MTQVSSNDRCDFFISRREVNANWAQWIAWVLEEDGYTTYLQDWDFRPGKSFLRYMQEGMTKCRRTIAVLSSAYAEGPYSTAEWEAALIRDPTGAEHTLITVRVEDYRPEGLLARYPHIDLFELEEDAARAELLKGVAEGRRKPPVAPHFPGRHPAPAFPGPPLSSTDQAVAQDGAAEALTRVQSLLPRGAAYAGGSLYVGAACLPRVPLVRPAMLATDQFVRSITRRAMDTEPPVLEMQDTSPTVADGRLAIEQRDRGLILDPSASVLLVRLPPYERKRAPALLSSVIEEDVQEKIACVLSFVAQTLDVLDTARSAHHVVPIAAIVGVNHVGWRTRAERDASPNTMTMNMFGAEKTVVALDPPAITRRALTAEGSEVAADLTALLRNRVRKQY